MLNRRLTSLALALSTALPAYAERLQDNYTTLEEVVVSSSRPLAFDSRLATTSVIDEKTFEEIKPYTLPDILRFTPGVSVSTNGGMGQPASISIRGTSGAQSPMFLNGLRINSSSSGDAPYALITPDFIERVEVYRGPASTTFGADAIGGAIQLFTPTTFGDDRTKIEVGGGTQGTGFTHINTRQQVGGWNLYGGAKYYSTLGQDSTLSSVYGHEDDRDGYKGGSFLASAAHEFGDNGLINFFGMTLPAETQYDADPLYANRNRSQVSAYGVNAQGYFNDTYGYTATVGATQDRAYFYRPNTDLPGDTFSTWRYQGTGAITQMLHWTDVHLTNKIGVEVTQEQLAGSAHYTETGRTTAGISANSTLDYGKHSILLAARGDYFNPATENLVPTWNVGYSYQMNSNIRGRVSYGTSYRLPSFNDLYYPVYGNPDLKPERAHQGEVALDATWSPQVTSTLAVYQTYIHDLIQFSTTTWTPDNIASARIRGVEFSTRWKPWAGTDLQAQIAYTTPEDLELRHDLRRRPRLTSSVTAAHAWTEEFHTTLFANFIGPSYEDAENKETLDGYVLLGGNLAYNFYKGFTGTLTLNNLLDQRYETAQGYPSLGRAVYASVSYQF